MKKHILLAAAALLLSLTALAAPAKPGRIVYTQPDGSTIGIYLHGDEWFNWTTDDKGNYLEIDENGFYRISSAINEATIRKGLAEAKAVKSSVRRLQEETVLNAASMTTGTRHIPVVLVEFSNISFTVSDPKSAFDKLLNEKGYSDNGGTGSVNEYYYDNSHGTFNPVFDVYGPVNIQESSTVYAYNKKGGNGPGQVLYKACQALDGDIDFSQYDSNNDGDVDMILMYVAGNNCAEGGSKDTYMWPHQYYLSSNSDSAVKSNSFDNVSVDRYFFTSELKGAPGSNSGMCGIGTTCHEFAHSLGLPDFYDTDSEVNGSAGATYDYDLMCSGSYVNDGRTPPYMGAEELIMLGWMDSLTDITGNGTVTIPSIDNRVAFKASTSTANEYFVFECRKGSGWDAYLKPGLIVYHVDKSTKSGRISGTTPYRLWSQWEYTNAINAYGDHPCYYIIPAAATSSLNYTGSNNNLPFPTSTNTSFTPVDWENNETGFTFSKIAYSDGVVTMNVVNSNTIGVGGFVLDSDGNPISGATVSVAPSSSSISNIPTEKRRVLLKSVLSAPVESQTVTKTGADGSYYIELSDAGTYEISASQSGYVSQTIQTNVDRIITQTFYLLREGEEAPSDIYTYDPNNRYVWGIVDDNEEFITSLMAADIFPSSLMGKYVGKQIKSIAFKVYGEEDTTWKGVYAIVDYGDDRQLTKKVSDALVNVNDWTTVDVTEDELIIPSGKDLYIGYGLDSWGYDYPLDGYLADESTGLVGYTCAELNLTSSTWEAEVYSDAALCLAIRITVGDYVEPDTGYSFIADPKNGSYSAGDVFELNLIETTGDRKPASAIEWLLDDEPVSGTTVTLTAGSHVIEARFTTAAGDKKVVELELEVN